ncbi:MAG: hypothetical protein JXD18_00060 [Anaerolineae bacterium]|nr:hypothetical protein [Anaerolineae bacterium]
MQDTQPTPPGFKTVEASRQATLAAFDQIDETTLLRLTRLTLPEIRAIQQEVARVLPAGNLPAFVLSGLLQVKEQRVNPARVRRDLVALLRGSHLVPQGLYSVFVAGPAAVLYAYQKLLELSGKDVASAFPQGTWQFYLQFGLREDTARHTVETVGFHATLPAAPDPTVMAAAWVYAALELIYNYDDLLDADWTERVMLRTLLEEAANVGLADEPSFTGAAWDWHTRRPYRRPSSDTEYLPYRTAAFQRFLQERLRRLPSPAQKRFYQRYDAQRNAALSDYQEQMTILASLTPDRYQEHREPLPLWQAAIGFIWQGHTYLLPACHRDANGSPLCYPARPQHAPPIPLYTLPDGDLCDAASQPLTTDRGGRVWYQQSGQLLGYLRFPAPEVTLSWVDAILSSGAGGPASKLDLLLAESSRAFHPQIREQVPPETQAEIASLHCAPIIINWDTRPHDLPLAYIRRGRRGIGDHALTLFRTDRSVVFDQSHIFFDGIWGIAVSEITTDYATHWYDRLKDSALPVRMVPPRPLLLKVGEKTEELSAPHRRYEEAAAESSGVVMEKLSRLRYQLTQRGVHLTVNDLLMLYRSFHAAHYTPSFKVKEELEAFSGRHAPSQAQAVIAAIESTWLRFRETNPALLIPMDAGNVSPHERIFPTTFRNPLTDVQEKFAAAWDHYRAYCTDPAQWTPFDTVRRELLAYLKAFEELLNALKGVTMRGESFNTATIRLLAHLPPSMQHLLDQIPQRIGVLNEIIKGNEVFSNVGRVAPGTSIVRFISARDDGQTKELVWGIVTDDQERMQISLRDFRPFVPLLLDLGEAFLADLLAQDYLDSYVSGFNRFVAELNTLVAVEKPTRE